ncbi:MAG: methylenetetrahydrofolate reductase [Prevotella sp.]|nr:methylenetetrahydrofolate reductase [Prevotella sp.]MCD8305747.1 methylenetetrahydrofolate reductase [Prevotella sp.]
MKVIDILNGLTGRHFSFEVLPPLKGFGTAGLFRTVERIMANGPLFINVTNHHSEYVYTPLGDGRFERSRVQRRPGAVAIAGALQARLDIPVVPHVICSGITKEAIEYELLDLDFLGIENLLLLRGDKAREDKTFVPVDGGYAHTTELIAQVAEYNAGRFLGGSEMAVKGAGFCFGVACYPEKHEEAANPETDLHWLKAKQDLGAEYAVTQLFYDNAKYFSFVEKARAAGVTIPIIPALKPLSKLSQLTVVPKTFHVDIPEALANEARHCACDDDVKKLGVEWAVEQCRGLYEGGVRNIHFYTVSAVDSVVEITKRVCRN